MTAKGAKFRVRSGVHSRPGTDRNSLSYVTRSNRVVMITGLVQSDVHEIHQSSSMSVVILTPLTAVSYWCSVNFKMAASLAREPKYKSKKAKWTITVSNEF